MLNNLHGDGKKLFSPSGVSLITVDEYVSSKYVHSSEAWNMKYAFKYYKSTNRREKKRNENIKFELYLSPETSDETALKTICRYKLKVKITTPSLKNILNYTFSIEKKCFFFF